MLLIFFFFCFFIYRYELFQIAFYDYYNFNISRVISKIHDNNQQVLFEKKMI